MTKVNTGAKARELYVRQEGIKKVAIGMLKQNLSIELISQVTNLPVAAIEKLKANI